MIVLMNFLRKACTYAAPAQAAIDMAEQVNLMERAYQNYQKLPDADSKTQQIFQEALQECGLQNMPYQLKIHRSTCIPSPAFAATNKLISINIDVLKEAEEEEIKKLKIKQITKHEAGHLFYHHNYSIFHISATIGTCFHIASRWINDSLPTPRTPAQAVLFSIPMVLYACSQVDLYPTLKEQLHHAKKKLQEKQADDFAIQHTSNPRELQAAGDFYETRLRNTIRQKLNLAIPGPSETILKRIYTELIMVQLSDPPPPAVWVAPNQYNLRRPIESLLTTDPLTALPPSFEESLKYPSPGDVHPSDYQRMMTFRKAAEQLRNPRPPKPDLSIPPEPLIEFS
jgi:hypothetical protein